MNSQTITWSEIEAWNAMIKLGKVSNDTNIDTKRVATEFMVWSRALAERITQDRLVLAEREERI